MAKMLKSEEYTDDHEIKEYVIESNKLYNELIYADGVVVNLEEDKILHNYMLINRLIDYINLRTILSFQFNIETNTAIQYGFLEDKGVHYFAFIRGSYITQIIKIIKDDSGKYKLRPDVIEKIIVRENNLMRSLKISIKEHEKEIAKWEIELNK